MSCNKGRQTNFYRGKEMNWRCPESPTPPARQGDTWRATREDTWIGDIGRAGHHQPDWETELLQEKTNELETSGEPDTTASKSWEISILREAWTATPSNKMESPCIGAPAHLPLSGRCRNWWMLPGEIPSRSHRTRHTSFFAYACCPYCKVRIAEFSKDHVGGMLNGLLYGLGAGGSDVSRAFMVGEVCLVPHHV